MPAAIWALAIAAFGIGTTEFVISGLLPGIAAEFAISIPTAGYTATSYALGVFVGAPLLVVLGLRLPQKTMLMAGFGFASVAPIQRLVLDKARAAGASSNLIASFNIGLFNLGNAIGAWLGGWVIAQGFGYAAPNWAGGLLSALALGLALLSGWVAAAHATRRAGADICRAG